MDECGVPAGLPDRVDDGLAFRLDDVGDDDASAFAGEQLGGDPADPARRAGDQRHPSVETSHRPAIIPHRAGLHHDLRPDPDQVAARRHAPCFG